VYICASWYDPYLRCYIHVYRWCLHV